MPLQSKILSGNARLEQAAAGGPSVKPAPPRDDADAVRRIQKALVALGVSTMPISFPGGPGSEPDGVYGQETMDAVIAFQKRVFPNNPIEWDGRVGPKTLAKMDALLPKGGSGPAPPGPSPAPGPQVVPFSPTPPLILIAIFDNPLKSDLDAADPPATPLTLREQLAIAGMDLLPTLVLEASMSGELALMAQSLGLEMFNHFVSNTTAGGPILFGTSTALSIKVAGTKGFEGLHDKIKVEFDGLLKAQFAAGKVDVRALEATTAGTASGGRRKLTNPAGIKTDPIVAFAKTELALHAVIGGQFQGGVVTVTAFTADATAATYKATLQYKLLDHFGVDNSDVVFDGFHGTPGQKAFWVLQHQRHPGHNPYVTTVLIEREVSGSLTP
jgi:hypothetical protein